MNKMRSRRAAPTPPLHGVPPAEISRRLTLEAAKDQRLEIRVSKAEKALVEKLASRYSVTTSALLVTLARIANEQLER